MSQQPPARKIKTFADSQAIVSSDEEETLKDIIQTPPSDSQLCVDDYEIEEEKERFEKSIYDVRQAYFILKRWMDPTKNFGKEDLIPFEILEKIFLCEDNVILQKLNFNREAQKRLLVWIHEKLVEIVRKNLIQEKLSIWEKKPQCFAAIANCFNTENCTIFTPITHENIPSIEKLKSLVNESDVEENNKVAHVLQSEDIEDIRIWTLKTFETHRQICECCINTYIQFNLETHPNKEFRKNFVDTLIHSNLWKENAEAAKLQQTDFFRPDSKKQKI